MQAGYKNPVDLGYYQVTSGLNTAKTLATIIGAAIPAGTQFVLIQPEVKAVRVRSDGTAPTAAIGYPLAIGQEMTFDASQIPELKIIEQAASATLNIWFFG